MKPVIGTGPIRKITDRHVIRLSQSAHAISPEVASLMQATHAKEWLNFPPTKYHKISDFDHKFKFRFRMKQE